VQPESPLSPGTNALLANNRWRLVEITYRGEAVEVDAIQPVYFTFDVTGYLSIKPTKCNVGGYQIIPFYSGDQMLMPKRVRSARQHLWRNLLIVSLFWVVIVITSACVAGSEVTQSPSPLSPNTASLLVGNRWKVAEITFQGESIRLDALEPLYFWFEQAGVLNLTSSLCPGGAFLIFFESERRYKLGRGDVPAVGCSELSSRQMADVQNALKATREFEIRGNQLFLIGPDVRIVLETDNPR
jgi:hypothetical protein